MKCTMQYQYVELQLIKNGCWNFELCDLSAISRKNNCTVIGSRASFLICFAHFLGWFKAPTYFGEDITDIFLLATAQHKHCSISKVQSDKNPVLDKQMKTKRKQNDIQYEYIKTHTGKIRNISTESNLCEHVYN